FRVLQESLTNVHRHSGSPTADVELFLANGNVILRITDRGRGIAWLKSGQPNDFVSNFGVGLRGMRERLRQLKGTLDISSIPGKTVIIATVPLSAPPQAAPQAP